MPFEVGARVRTRERRSSGHTRLPGYLADRQGRVVAVLGDYRFADEGAEQGSRASKQPLYTVEFSEGAHTIHADLFEAYLESDA